MNSISTVSIRTKNGYITWNHEWICSIDDPGKLTINDKTYHYVNGIITVLRVISIPNHDLVPGRMLYEFTCSCDVSKMPTSLCSNCYRINRSPIETNCINLCKDCLWRRHLFAVNMKVVVSEDYQCNAIIRTETDAIFFTTKIFH